MGQGIAVHFWHQDIGDDQGGVFLMHLLQCFLAVSGGNHRIPFKTKGDFEQFKNVRYVFDNQDGTKSNIHSAAIVAVFMAAYKRGALQRQAHLFEIYGRTTW